MDANSPTAELPSLEIILRNVKVWPKQGKFDDNLQGCQDDVAQNFSTITLKLATANVRTLEQDHIIPGGQVSIKQLNCKYNLPMMVCMSLRFRKEGLEFRGRHHMVFSNASYQQDAKDKLVSNFRSMWKPFRKTLAFKNKHIKTFAFGRLRPESWL